MDVLKFFRTETLPNKRLRSLYKTEVPSLDFCDSIMQIIDFNKKSIRVTVEGEEMKPDIIIKVNAFSDIENLAKKEKVSSCLFNGLFNSKEIDVVVDFGSKQLIIVSDDNSIIENFKTRLEKK